MCIYLQDNYYFYHIVPKVCKESCTILVFYQIFLIYRDDKP